MFVTSFRRADVRENGLFCCISQQHRCIFHSLHPQAFIAFQPNFHQLVSTKHIQVSTLFQPVSSYPVETNFQWQFFESSPPGGRGVLGSGFAGYVPLASQNSHPIIVYSVANYRPHLSHFWANVIVISRTEFNTSRLLNIKKTAGTIFQPQIFLFLNPCLSEFSYPKHSENLLPHSSNSTENVTPLQSVQLRNCDPIQRHIPSSLLLGSTPPGLKAPLKSTIFKYEQRECI